MQLPIRKADISIFQKYINYLEKHVQMPTKNIALVGKYVEIEDSYLSVDKALHSAGIESQVQINIIWIEAQDLEVQTQQ